MPLTDSQNRTDEKEPHPFWFGQTERCRPTPHEGWTPSTALELQARLNDLLTDNQSRKIAIRVIDVSIPPASTSM